MTTRGGQTPLVPVPSRDVRPPEPEREPVRRRSLHLGQLPMLALLVMETAQADSVLELVAAYPNPR